MVLEVPISIDGEHKTRLLAKRRDCADWLTGIEIGKVENLIQSGVIGKLTADGVLQIYHQKNKNRNPTNDSHHSSKL